VNIVGQLRELFQVDFEADRIALFGFFDTLLLDYFD